MTERRLKLLKKKYLREGYKMALMNEKFDTSQQGLNDAHSFTKGAYDKFMEFEEYLEELIDAYQTIYEPYYEKKAKQIKRMVHNMFHTK